MPLTQCPDCEKEISDTAPSCPHCGRLNPSVEVVKPNASQIPSSQRKVSIPLMIGILLIPLISAWFTLKKGYSTKARAISFGWLLLTLVVGTTSGLDKAPVASTANAGTSLMAPILDEVKILQASGLEVVKRYDLDDGHGFYVQQGPDAAIEFRTSPPKINLALRTFPEAGYEEKNAEAQRMITKLASVITGTDGKLIDDAMAGKVKLGGHVINGLPVNVSRVSDNNLLVTISKQ